MSLDWPCPWRGSIFEGRLERNAQFWPLRWVIFEGLLKRKAHVGPYDLSFLKDVSSETLTCGHLCRWGILPQKNRRVGARSSPQSDGAEGEKNACVVSPATARCVPAVPPPNGPFGGACGGSPDEGCWNLSPRPFFSWGRGRRPVQVQLRTCPVRLGGGSPEAPRLLAFFCQRWGPVLFKFAAPSSVQVARAR